MLQHCKFTRPHPDCKYLICETCESSIETEADNAIQICKVEAEDSPERDPDTLPCVHRGERLRSEKADVPPTRREGVSVFACSQCGECSLESKLQGIEDCMRCERRDPGAASWKPEFAPLRKGVMQAKPWEGACSRKPWQYDVAVMIPVLDCVEPLPLVVDLLRLQTLKPYIILVDTGSLPESFAKVEALRAPDLEVHSLRLNGFEHSSQSVAMACDVGFAVCQSRFLFLTHTDCFLRSRTVLEEFAELCQDHPVVGYQISPRPHEDWQRMCGHTATMVDMDAVHDLGVTWNFRRLCRNHGVSVKPAPERPNWPDTEVGFNYLCWDAGVEAKLVGVEENWLRTLDDRIDHCRSFPSSAIYAPGHAEEKMQWIHEAMESAERRIAEWRENPATEVKREWRKREITPKPLPAFRESWKRC